LSSLGSTLSVRLKLRARQADEEHRDVRARAAPIRRASPHCPPPGLMCGHIFTLVECLPYIRTWARPSKLKPGDGAPLVVFGGIDDDQMTKILSVLISKSARLQRTACTPDCCCAALMRDQGCAVTVVTITARQHCTTRAIKHEPMEGSTQKVCKTVQDSVAP
jgi:hypothetical protein